jgi:hypothetical protein
VGRGWGVAGIDINLSHFSHMKQLAQLYKKKKIIHACSHMCLKSLKSHSISWGKTLLVLSHSPGREQLVTLYQRLLQRTHGTQSSLTPWFNLG